MILNLIRFVFLVLVSAVSVVYLLKSVNPDNSYPYVIMLGGVISALAVITCDILIRHKNLGALSGVFFGIIVGLLVTFGLSLLGDAVLKAFLDADTLEKSRQLVTGVKLLLGLTFCYLSVSFVLQTKDDFRFIIPYVEFTRATKGARPLLLDTSVIIDGRIAELAATGIFESHILVPRFVLAELQAVADSADKLKRGRGRRGLEILQRLQAMPKLDLHIWDGTLAETLPGESVDEQLVALAQQEKGRIITNDYNLNKIAQLRGVDVINLNDIATTLKPAVLPGEQLKVRIIKPGEGTGQGVGYLEDGTMVVVEGGRDKIGADVELIVTNTRQTSAGKMIFGRTDSEGQAPDSLVSMEPRRGARPERIERPRVQPPA